MIEVMFAVRKDKFQVYTNSTVFYTEPHVAHVRYLLSLSLSLCCSPQDYPAIGDGLDLVQEDDQITHLLSLSDNHDGDEMLNVFQEDNDYLANEDKYKEIKAGELTTVTTKLHTYVLGQLYQVARLLTRCLGTAVPSCPLANKVS